MGIGISTALAGTTTNPCHLINLWLPEELFVIFNHCVADDLVSSTFVIFFKLKDE